MTDSYVMLNAQDAQQLNVAEGQILSVQLTDGALTLPVRISTQLTAGQIGLPLGMRAFRRYWRVRRLICRRWHNEQLVYT